MRRLKLGSIAKISAGNGAPQKKELFKDGKYPFFRTSDVGAVHYSKNLDTVRDYLNEDGIIGLKKFNKGTILFPKSGASTYLNHRAIMGVDGYVVSHLGAIEANPELVNNVFLYYFLTTVDAKSLNQDQDYPSLKNSVIGSIEVPLPPLSEQRRVVEMLDAALLKIDQATQLTRENIRNTEYLYKSKYDELTRNVEGASVALSEVCEIAVKLVDPRDDPYSSCLHIGAANIEQKTGALRDLKTAKEEKLISSKFPFDKNTVLYSKIRPYLMKVVRPDFSGICSADIYPLTVKSGFDKDYLYYILLSPGFTNYAIQGSQRAGMPKVNREHLFAYRFDLPNLKDQKLLVGKLDQLSMVTNVATKRYEEKLQNLSLLRESVLNKSFSQIGVEY